jgi:hypothetical protein
LYKLIKMAVVDYTQLDIEVDAFLAQHQSKLASGEPLTAIQICPIYTGVVRTVLEAVQSLLAFFKPTWGQVLGVLIGVLDQVCHPPVPPVA